MDAENFFHRDQPGFGIDFHLGELHAARAVGSQTRLPLAVNDERIDAEFFAGGEPVFATRVGHAALVCNCCNALVQMSFTGGH